MSLQFKFRAEVGEERRREIVAALKRAGFEARSLFPGQKRAQLAAIFTVSKAGAKDIQILNAALTEYDPDIEYVEEAPAREPKS